jgi:alpha-glucosidase
MSRATHDGLAKASGIRPFVLSRAAYAGTQKYAAVWTGDNQSMWEHLRMSLPMLMNLSLSGHTFCGSDIGGFAFDCTSEMLSRWVQAGFLIPLFRNHSNIRTRDQEPWAFDDETTAIYKKYVQLRYALLPYIYDLVYESSKDGLPVIRPLTLHYQSDAVAHNINDEFLCGRNILVAPVVNQGDRVKLVYLPSGNRWVDYWTHEIFEGGQYIIKDAPIDTCPMFIREGGIIPEYPVLNFVGERDKDTYL